MKVKIFILFLFLILSAVSVSLFFYSRSLKSELELSNSKITTLNNIINEKEKEISILKSSERINISMLESLKSDLDSLSQIKDIQIEEIPNLDKDWNSTELPKSISSFLNNADKQYREKK